MQFEKKDSSYLLKLTEQEYKRLGLDKIQAFEIIGVKNKLWLLLPSPTKDKPELLEETQKTEPRKETQKSEPQKEEQTLIQKLSTRNWADLVVGKFEKKLNKQELEVFKQLIKQGRIKKLQKPKYKNPIYQFAVQEKKIESVSIFKSVPEANTYATQNKDLIQDGKIKGIKDFDGTIYFISSETIETLSPKILSSLPSDLDSLSKTLNTDSQTIKAVLVFLTEEGQVYQPKKNQYLRA